MFNLVGLLLNVCLSFPICCKDAIHIEIVQSSHCILSYWVS